MAFMSWYVVLLKKGPTWSADATPELEVLQQGHLAHLASLAQAGKLVEAGPVQDHGDGALRGVCLYRGDAVASLDELKALVEADPSIQAGRLRADYATWYVNDAGFLARAAA